jgi:hypothetical protein
MADCLEIIFRSFWTWLGTFFLLGVLAQGLGGLIRITFKQ